MEQEKFQNELIEIITLEGKELDFKELANLYNNKNDKKISSSDIVNFFVNFKSSNLSDVGENENFENIDAKVEYFEQQFKNKKIFFHFSEKDILKLKKSNYEENEIDNLSSLTFDNFKKIKSIVNLKLVSEGIKIDKETDASQSINETNQNILLQEQSRDKKLENLLSFIPKYLKNVYIAYLEEEKSSEKFMHLCHFSEALAAYFACLSHTSFNTDNESISSVIYNKLLQGITFGTWIESIYLNDINGNDKSIIKKIEDLYNKKTNDEKNHILNFFERIRALRNKHKGHGSVSEDWDSVLEKTEDCILVFSGFLIYFFSEHPLFFVNEIDEYKYKNKKYKLKEIKNDYLKRNSINQSDILNEKSISLKKGEYYIKLDNQVQQLGNYVLLSEDHSTFYLLSKITMNDIDKTLEVEYINYTNKNGVDRKYITLEKIKEENTLLLTKINEVVFKDNLNKFKKEFGKQVSLKDIVKSDIDAKSVYLELSDKTQIRDITDIQNIEDQFENIINVFSKNMNTKNIGLFSSDKISSKKTLYMIIKLENEDQAEYILIPLNKDLSKIELNNEFFEPSFENEEYNFIADNVKIINTEFEFDNQESINVNFYDDEKENIKNHFKSKFIKYKNTIEPTLSYNEDKKIYEFIVKIRLEIFEPQKHIHFGDFMTNIDLRCNSIKELSECIKNMKK